jgi:cysteinyl-tRNA synthetase
MLAVESVVPKLVVAMAVGGVASAGLSCETDAVREPPRAPKSVPAGDATPPGSRREAAAAAELRSLGPGFPALGPWVAFYGTAAQMGDLERVAASFRIIDIDVDPGADGEGNFTDAQIRTLQDGGRNRVLAYLNLGSCERFRTYWTSAPAGLVPCGRNRDAWLGDYEGYADEEWMNPADPSYARLILEHVAPRLAARGIDGFYLDNLEIIEHLDPAEPAWCSPECRQAAMDLVRRLRERFPDRLLVLQNATGSTTRTGSTGGVRFAALLDGVAHEEVYGPTFDPKAERDLLAWLAMRIRTADGRPFFVGVEDYVGSCANSAAANASYQRSRAHGFSPYASDASNSQHKVCYWPF